MIRLKNDDNKNVYLEKIDENEYYIKGDINYIQVSYDVDEKKGTSKIKSIRPEGGPYIEVNYFKLDNETVLRSIDEIQSNLFKLTFDK